jgi:hypothetical protein
MHVIAARTDTLFARSPLIVNLARPEIRGKRFHGGDDVTTMDIVAHLLTLGEEDRIRPASKRDLYEI